MAKISHLQSATQVITMNGIKILTDPWLTDGEYFGSWFHHPNFPENELPKLSYDFVYVSHIHPDHLSQSTFSKLPIKVPVIIPKFSSPFLKRKIESFGWQVVELGHAQPHMLGSNVSITIFLADNCDPTLCGRFFGCKVDDAAAMSPNIDSIALFDSGETKILNTNDSPFDLAKHTIIKNNLVEEIDLLLVGYAGAGPYPQCFDLEPDVMQKEIAAKKKKFLDFAVNYVDLVKPKFYIPFAGTYILGGKLSALNNQRGVPTLSEAITYIDKNISVSSCTGVEMQQFDQFDISAERHIRAHNILELSDTLDIISGREYSFPENVPCRDIDHLVAQAYQRFSSVGDQISLDSTTLVEISTDKVQIVFSRNQEPQINMNWKSPVGAASLKIELQHNLLLALLNGPRWAHWNNAEIGSHLKFRRQNVEFERELGHALYFFHA